MLTPDSGCLRVIVAPTHVLMGPGTTSSDPPQAPRRFLFVFETASLTGLELATQAMLSGRRAPRICLSLWPEH